MLVMGFLSHGDQAKTRILFIQTHINRQALNLIVILQVTMNFITG